MDTVTKHWGTMSKREQIKSACELASEHQEIFTSHEVYAILKAKNRTRVSFKEAALAMGKATYLEPEGTIYKEYGSSGGNLRAYRWKKC
jgi:ornithine carbamoyltransferase